MPLPLPLALFSMGVLAIEVLLTRLLSYSVHTVVLYAVLGIALLGFGAAGTLVAMRPGWLLPERLPRVLAWSALSTVAATVLVHACFLRLTPALQAMSLLAFAAAALLMLPFVAAGTAITLSLASAGQGTGRAYAANLIGSGLGCALPLLLLGPLDAPRLLGALSLATWAASIPWVHAATRSKQDALRWAQLAAGALALASVVWAPQWFPLIPEPAPLGQVAMIAEHARTHDIRMTRRYVGASAVGRVEIFAFENVAGDRAPYPFMFYAQDSSAGSTIVRWDGQTRSQAPSGASRSEVARLCTDTVYASGYFAARDDVLVIGLGGGPDLLCALYHEAKHVDVVDINPRTLEAISGPLSGFLGGAPRRAGVHLHLRDGRSFARAAPAARYDLIQLSGTDTKQNLAAGSLTLAENHLYTVEAFEDYLRSLTDAGVLAIIRFGEAEALRLANTAMLALQRRGVERPAQHVAILQNGILQTVLVRRAPFTPSDSEQLSRHMSPARFEGVDVFFARLYDLPFHRPVVLGHAPHLPRDPRLAEFFAQSEGGQNTQFTKTYPFDISPTTDDRPFFFDLHRHDDIGRFLQAPHMRVLRNVAASLALLSLVLVLLPVAAGYRTLRGSAAWTVPLYFTSIGFAFLFVEVWLLSRFSMYLGHQTHGLAVVLSGLLVSSGIGAALGDRIVASTRGRGLLAGAAISGLLLLAAYGASAITSATLSASLPARVLLTLLSVLPLGVCMGVCMPAGLDFARTAYPGSVPLCVGVNGFSSVLATILVLPMSLYFGYVGVLTAGVILYALSSVLALAWRAGPSG